RQSVRAGQRVQRRRQLVQVRLRADRRYVTPANNPVLINEKAGFLTFDAVAALRVAIAAVRDCKRYVLVPRRDPAGRPVTNKVHHPAAARHTLETPTVNSAGTDIQKPGSLR